jgi:hypothetical protein
MRIKNKYLRNRIFRSKNFNRIRRKEHPYCCSVPWSIDGKIYYPIEEQIEYHFKWINQQARAFENGCHSGVFHATSSYRRIHNQSFKAKEQSALAKINRGNYDIEFPIFKKNADWYYF